MADLIARIASASPPLLWLDDTAYAERLFGGGRMPWLDPAALVSLRRKAAGLLQLAVTAVPIDAIVRAWLQENSDLRAAMQAKKRTVAPLRTLLADESMRTKLVEVVAALRDTFSAVPFVLTLPSPRRWVFQAHRLAHGEDVPLEVGEQETDSAALYVADFLRTFGDLNVDALLLQEVGSGPADDTPLEWYRAVMNLCAHYRWQPGLQLQQQHGLGSSPQGLAFAIAARPLPALPTGIETPAQFWSGAARPPIGHGAFRFARIPPDCRPEQVLERVLTLRAE